MTRRMACVFWFSLLLPVGAAGSAEDTPPAAADWGVERGEPTDAGFLFWNGSYVRAPYLVERRGLDIHINGILVSRGPHSPAAAPSEDPGEPPPGVSPFDPFFSEKWRYLSSRYGRREATRLMLRAYKKCEGFSTVAERDDTIRVTDNLTGDEAYITLSDSWKMALQPNERLLAGRAAKKRYYEQLLRHNRVVSLFADGEHVVAGSDAITTLSVLLSAKTPQDKIRMLEQRGILKPGDTAAQRIVMEYREDAQLAERYGRLAQGEPLAGPAVAATGTALPAVPPVASAGAPAAHGPDAASSWPAPAFAAAAAVACALALLARRKRRTR